MTSRSSRQIPCSVPCEGADVLRAIRPGAWPLLGRLGSCSAVRDVSEASVGILVAAAVRFPEADLGHYLLCALGALTERVAALRGVMSPAQ